MDDSTPAERSQRATEVLEIEDEEQRQERMHSLLARLNSTSSASTSGPSVPPRPFDLGDRSALPIEPPVDLLSRVQAFLPQLAASNEELLRRARENPESVDIENLGEHEERYIQMNLGLGVFDHRGELPPGIPVANVDTDVKMQDSDSSTDSEDGSSTSSSDSSSSDSSDDEEDSDSDADSDSDSSLEVDIVVSSDQTKKSRPTKPLPKRTVTNAHKPEIVVLSETTDDSASLK